MVVVICCRIISESISSIVFIGLLLELIVSVLKKTWHKDKVGQCLIVMVFDLFKQSMSVWLCWGCSQNNMVKCHKSHGVMVMID